MIHQSTRAGKCWKPVQATLKERWKRDWCKTKDTKQKSQDDCKTLIEKTLKKLWSSENGEW